MKNDDWRQERRTAPERARCIVVKVGSAVIGTASGVDLGVIDNLAAQLSALRRGPNGTRRSVILVSSGAVAAGRAALAEFGREADGTAGQGTDLAVRQAAAAVGQGRLMHLYDQAFALHGALTAQVLLTRDDLRSRERFLNVRNTFGALLSRGVIPVVNENDTVSVNELKFSDNDNLAGLLLNTVEADLFINLTSIGGVLEADPRVRPDARIMPCIERVRELNLDALCSGKTSVGTGGMHSKLLSAMRAAQLGVPTFILPGRERDVITRAFAGEELGTWVRPEPRTVSRRKYWLAYQAEPQGRIEVDAGAAEALLDRGKSLLPGGIVAVQGDFDAGALVRLCREGRDLGVGLVNYAARDLDRIKGLRRHEVAAVLGDAHYPEVVHRDNMLLDAAL